MFYVNMLVLRDLILARCDRNVGYYILCRSELVRIIPLRVFSVMIWVLKNINVA